MSALPRRIASAGAGRMGRGIALAFAYAGYEVALVDLKARAAVDREKLREDAQAEMHASLSMLADLEAMPRDAVGRVLRRIRIVAEADAPEALADAEVVFEGVPETFAAKQAALARLCALIPADAILASTTSTILPGELAAFATRPERFLNAHWLNPAFVIPLVELSAHSGTAHATIARLGALLEDIGKVPVRCACSRGTM